VEVRVAAETDARAIGEVHVRSWQTVYRGQVPDDFLDALSMDNRANAWRQIIADSALPAKGAFVLEDEDQVVGFAHVSPSRDEDGQSGSGEVTAIYLHPDFWGRGGGRALMDRALDSLREAGFSIATLWVLDTNARARRFYEATGWSRDGGTKQDDRGAFVLSELRYRRELL
jgi:GNAT superfamily N-acetyltransferase